MKRAPNRSVWVVAGLMGLMAGCAVAPNASEPTVASPSLAAAQSEAAPAASADPSAQPFMPSQPPPTPCDPRIAPFGLSVTAFGGASVRAGDDGLLVSRCQEHFIQRVGKAPVPLAMRTDDFWIAWAAADGSSLIGIHLTSGSMIRRSTKEPRDEVLADGRITRVAVSPDGRTIAFSKDKTMEAEPYPQPELFLLRTDTLERKTMPGILAYSLLRWSPDGQRFLYSYRETSSDYPRLAWTNWDDSQPHVLGGEVQYRYDPVRGAVSWMGDQNHLLIYVRDHDISVQRGKLLQLDLNGALVSEKPLVDSAGKPLSDFYPIDVQAGNPLVLGHNGVLDTRTGVVSVFSPEAGMIRWGAEPGTLLRWRVTPDGPRLDAPRLKDIGP